MNLKGLDILEKLQHTETCKKNKKNQSISDDAGTSRTLSNALTCKKCGKQLNSNKSIDILKHKKYCIKKEN